MFSPVGSPAKKTPRPSSPYMTTKQCVPGPKFEPAKKPAPSALSPSPAYLQQNLASIVTDARIRQLPPIPKLVPKKRPTPPTIFPEPALNVQYQALEQKDYNANSWGSSAYLSQEAQNTSEHIQRYALKLEPEKKPAPSALFPSPEYVQQNLASIATDATQRIRQLPPIPTKEPTPPMIFPEPVLDVGLTNTSPTTPFPGNIFLQDKKYIYTLFQAFEQNSHSANSWGNSASMSQEVKTRNTFGHFQRLAQERKKAVNYFYIRF